MASVDNLWVIVTVFALGVAMLGTGIFFQFMTTDTHLDSDLFGGSTVGPTLKASAVDFFSKWDLILILAVFSVHLGIIVLGYFLRTEPIMYVAALILIVMIGLMTPVISNAWEDIVVSNSDIAGVATTIPKFNYYMMNLPKFEIVWGFITAITLYGFGRKEGVF